jgi:hypothetical protein
MLFMAFSRVDTTAKINTNTDLVKRRRRLHTICFRRSLHDAFSELHAANLHVWLTFVVFSGGAH